MSVASLGYIGFESNNLSQWREYGENFLGLMDVSGSETELRFRMDDQSWRIAISTGPREDIIYAGFDAFDEENLDDLVQHLVDRGDEVIEDSDLAEVRGVQRLYRMTDPDGLQIELYLGMLEVAEKPLVSPAGVSGFITGDQGLGHIVLFTKDMQQKYAFYTNGLGFELSDTILLNGKGRGGKLSLKFLHCNPRHHSIALVPVPAEKHLNHFMLQANHLNDVGFALDRAQAAGIQITTTLGCHTNDRMVSFYAATPSGFEVEFGYGARVIEPDWTEGFHISPSLWGHKKG